MKQYLINSKRFTTAIIAMTLVTGALITPQFLEAQSATQKVRLMADTLRARDSGNLDLAKQKAEELIIIAPEDENVQRLLASINRDLESRMVDSPGGVDRQSSGVFGQADEVSIEEVMEAGLVTDADGLEVGAEAQAEAVDNSIIQTAVAKQVELIDAADAAVTQAYILANLGEFSAATTELNNAAARLPRNTATESILTAIEEAKLDIILSQAKMLASSGDLKAAASMVESYREAGGDARKANALARSLNKKMSNPYNQDINEVSPEYVTQSKTIRELLTRGRAQFLSGDYAGAQATFNEVEARDANNSEAKLLQTRIAKILGDVHQQTRYKTREQMLTEVDQNWERPKVFDIAEVNPDDVVDEGLREKLNKIIIPEVKFNGVELTRVLETLSELSAVYDPDNVGINIVPIFKPGENNPKVSITLRKLSLDRVLEFVTQQVNFSYDVGSDVVTVQPSDGLGGVASMITETFTISRGVEIAIIGVGQGGGATETVNPFAAPTSSGGGGGGGEDAEKFKSFFQRAGVNFGLTGTDLAYTEDGKLYVTQTKRNLERMKKLLRSMDQVQQVEIEAKFLEVAQNDLDELGFNWGVSDGPQTLIEAGFPVADQFGNPTVEYQRRGQTQGRTINNAFSTDTATSAINISGFDPISVAPPSLNTSIDLAAGANDLFSASGWSVLGADVQFAIRALSRKASSDVMSAPKVTVMSGSEAQITVAQELRYPESYGEIQSEVGSSGGNNNNNSGGSSSISITAATPEEFVTRNVGVELSVKPKVEEDDSITLTLTPSVTEFEGFVEYGGPSVAISGGSQGILDPITGILTGGTEATVVTVPAGFYQPIFSTRRISTTVSVYDGATLVMGGLTRDEVKSFNDKVPVLGDIPGVGRLFRSEGETRQKRNLLIFVTANIVSPGGSPSNQDYRNVKANSLYQNPTIMTPSGSVNRNIDDQGQ